MTNDNEQQGEVEPRAMLAAYLHGELRDGMIEEIKAAPEVWQKLPQTMQDRVIDRIDRRVFSMLSHALDVLIAHEIPVVRGRLEQVTVKDGIKAVVTLSRTSPDRYAIIDAVGAEVRLAVADGRVFTGEPGKVTSDPDQRDLEGIERVEATGADAGQTDGN